MNLYLTHKCNRGCPFCFARKVLQEAGNDLDELLTIEEVRTLLDHFPEIENSTKNIGLLGGEPFLYPYLRELLELLDERGISAKIFTSATDKLPEVLDEKKIEDAVGKLCFIVNVGSKDTYTPQKLQNLTSFFRKYAQLSSLSFTICDLNASPDYLFEMIEEFNLNRNIRTGIALPILYGGNKFISLNDYKAAGEYFVNVAEQASKKQITLSMDCGFIACMFTNRQIGKLLRLGTGVHFMCGTAMDIGPKLQAWNCFPLFQIGRIDALRAENLSELQKMLNDAVYNYLGVSCGGILPECKQCDLIQKGLCEGGCISYKSIK